MKDEITIERIMELAAEDEEYANSIFSVEGFYYPTKIYDAAQKSADRAAVLREYVELVSGRKPLVVRQSS